MTREKRQTKASVHYVENKVFTAAIIEHNKACREAIENEVENQEFQNTLENVSIRSRLDSQLNRILSTIHIEMR